MVNEESLVGSDPKPFVRVFVRIVAWTVGGALVGAIPGVLMLIGDLSEGNGLTGGMLGGMWILFVAVGISIGGPLGFLIGLGVEWYKLRRK